MIGSGFVFVGFLIGSILGPQYGQYLLQKNEFGDCFDYSGGNAVKVSCDQKLQDEYGVLAIVFLLIGIGIYVMIKGLHGKWDQDIKSSEMLGPKRP